MSEDERRLLKGARKVLARGWCQNAMARDAAGMMVDSWGRRAVAWCLLGAMLAVARRARGLALRQRFAVAFGRLEKHLEAITREPLQPWNDREGRSAADVLRLVDTALSGRRR